VIAGFDALNIMEAIYRLTLLIQQKEWRVENLYPRVATAQGNVKAWSFMQEVFEVNDSTWRSIGLITESGLKIRKAFQDFDAQRRFKLTPTIIPEPAGCLCGSILMGKNNPKDCPHFGQGCTPSCPIGPCMVSSEGTCAAYFKYQV